MEARTRLLLVTALLAVVSLTGCGVARRMAISEMVPVLECSVEAIYRDQDVETVGLGIPSNLLLLRGLCETNPKNRDLWALTIQLYFYYGVGYVEDEDPERAKLVFEQALSLGRRAMERRGWITPSDDIDAFRRRLEKVDRGDVPLLFWSLANWTKWIGANLNDPAALADLPLAEVALDRVLQLDAGYFLGIPHVMRGTLEASKPVLTGGDPEIARRHFEQAFAISERKLLIFHVFYAQYYCRSQLDAEGFEETLREVLDAPADLKPAYRLLNEVARRKASSLMEQKDDLF